jgi:regulator of sigma E protease
MIIHLFYFLLALIGLSFLIFIHELGHYFMALRVGMKVEVFSIGLGKPFYSWDVRGVRWQLCSLPFGGYVKIAGEKEENYQPGQRPADDTFLGKEPKDRIKVALMGPVVNIVFALFLFTLIWLSGGKSEPFSRHTNIIGYVDPDSELYQKGIRPGDQIARYNNRQFQGFKDLLYASVLKQKSLDIEGYKINYYDQNRESFHYLLTPYRDPRSAGADFRTIGILTPASVLMFSESSQGSDFPFDESPMKDSGIQYGDRIIWARGELVFSMQQLSKIVNDATTLISVERNGHLVALKVPRLKVADLRISHQQKEELEDWQHQIHRKGNIKELFFIPYVVDVTCTVKMPLAFIGEDSEEHTIYDDFEGALKVGDKIIAVDGVRVSQSYGLLDALQIRKIPLIVQRGFDPSSLTWSNENEVFTRALKPQDLRAVVQQVAEGVEQGSSGDIYALKPVEPILLSDLPLASAKKNWLTQEFVAQKERIEKVQDPVIREEAMKVLEKNRQKLVLGIPLGDIAVRYNPNPLALFVQVIGETSKTLGSLFTGKLNPKWMSGPIGMVQIIQHGWMVGVKEALFWMAAISLNLGIFNLLPLPVLDGGHICFSLYEWIFRRRLHPRTMEKLILPFIVLLVGLFVYVTYQDIVRLLGRFF